MTNVNVRPKHNITRHQPTPLCGGAGSAGHVCIGAGCSACCVGGSSQSLPVGGGMLAGAVCAAVAGLHRTTALQPCASGSTPTPIPCSRDIHNTKVAHGLQLPAVWQSNLLAFPKHTQLFQDSYTCQQLIGGVWEERTPEKGVQALKVQPSSGAVLAWVWK